MRYMTEFEIEKRNKNLRRTARREAIIGELLGGLRTIIYTPLSIAFHAVSFVSKIVGFVSSFGLLYGVYCLYQAFCKFTDGAPVKAFDTAERAIPFLIFPFIAYGIAVVAEKIYRYFEDNAF